MGNKKRHQKIFDPTDDERTEKIKKAKIHHDKYGTLDLDRKREWLKLRKYAFELIFKELKDNDFGEFKELEEVASFDKIYIRTSKLIEDIKYYTTMPEWGNVNKVEVMKTLIKAMLEKDRFEGSYLTKANYNREAENIKKSIEVIQSEYLDRMYDIAIKINQPLPELTQYRIPLHPNDNYKITLTVLLQIKVHSDYAENLLEVALNMKNVKTTKHRQKIIKESTDELSKDLYNSINDNCSHLPKEAQDALKEIVDATIDKFIPKP